MDYTLGDPGGTAGYHRAQLGRIQAINDWPDE